MAALIVVGIVVLAALVVAGFYNGLVRLRQRVKNAWSQIDVQLKRRYDLIPNLVETVKGYARHEKEVLEEITRLRSQWGESKTTDEKIKASAGLESVLARLLLVVERYPDLKANQNFLKLQEELTTTENRIGFARQHYNDQVMALNTKIEVFPSNLIAGMFNFVKEPFYTVEEGPAREPVKVSF